jgi:hypothetical protein
MLNLLNETSASGDVHEAVPLVFFIFPFADYRGTEALSIEKKAFSGRQPTRHKQ